MSDFEGATLALQHYYDIIEVSRNLPFLTLYRANEQPFGRRMNVWMESETLSPKLSASAHERLETAMLKNRAINTAHALRILDFGTGEGHNFVVTDELSGIPLYDYLQCRGPLQPWQFLRLAEQLTEIVSAAHDAGFRFLCMTSQNVFVTDNDRFEIMTCPLGIGLHRSELLGLKDTPITPDLMRHLPPWEFVETPEKIEEETEKVDLSSESIQDLDAHFESAALSTTTSGTTEVSTDGEFDSDIYAVSAILYEAISGQHPYFADGREICEAVLIMQRTAPRPLDASDAYSETVCQTIMQSLKQPAKDSLISLLSTLQKQFSTDVIQQAMRAEKHYLEAPELTNTSLQKKHKHKEIPYPKAVLSVAAIILVILTALITNHFSSQRQPVDLFALPEILPAAQEGVEVVLPLPQGQHNLSVYLSSFADGMPMRLGELPLLYSDQQPSGKLNFVIMDEQGKTVQVPVVLRDTPGLQVVNIDF